MYIYQGHMGSLYTSDDVDIDGSGGCDYDYIQEFINSNWEE